MKGLPTIEPERLIGQHPEILSQFKRSVIYKASNKRIICRPHLSLP